MTRLPRRTLRVKPPLRGRAASLKGQAATRHYQGEFAPVASVRRPRRPYGAERPVPPPYPGPPSPPGGPEAPVPQPPKTSLYADLVQLYRSWGRFLRSLDQPWQWLLALAIVFSSLLLLNRLL